MDRLKPNTIEPLSDVTQLRSLMPVSQQYIYLDHAAVSPLPGPTADAIQHWASDMRDHGVRHWQQWRDRIEQVRNLAAKLLNCQPQEAAVIRNTTEGISLIAEGWRWRPGDSVVVAGCEFPSNLYPWLNLREQGVEVRIAAANSSMDNDTYCSALADVCSSTTRIIATSFVDYATGRRRDLSMLADLARKHGARLFVDAIQGLGVLPLDASASQIDFLAADGHKWLLGPEGAGILYIREDCLPELRMVGPGWNSVAHAGDFSNRELILKPVASRYEAGTYNMAACAGLHASLTLLSKLSPPEIERAILVVRNEFLQAGCAAGLETDLIPESEASGIISFQSNRSPARKLFKLLREQGILTNVRDGRLRISPHLYNTADEARQFGDAVRCMTG